MGQSVGCRGQDLEAGIPRNCQEFPGTARQEALPALTAFTAGQKWGPLPTELPAELGSRAWGGEVAVREL